MSGRMIPPRAGGGASRVMREICWLSNGLSVGPAGAGGPHIAMRTGPGPAARRGFRQVVG